MRKLYGMTLGEFDALVEKQNGACEICGKIPSPDNQYAYSRLNVDHDHKTGKVRGLLCANCNRAIGMFGDNPATLNRAADYLRKAG
jgi:hypothetical protein